MHKWKSFYSELKINNNFWSSQYYLIYFIRRFIYLVCQVYLSQMLYIQSSIQVICSILFSVYLFYFRPFKNLSMLISTILSETCVFFIFVMSFFFIDDLVKGLEDYIEKAIIACIWTSIIL